MDQASERMKMDQMFAKLREKQPQDNKKKSKPMEELETALIDFHNAPSCEELFGNLAQNNKDKPNLKTAVKTSKDPKAAPIDRTVIIEEARTTNIMGPNPSNLAKPNTSDVLKKHINFFKHKQLRGEVNLSKANEDTLDCTGNLVGHHHYSTAPDNVLIADKTSENSKDSQSTCASPRGASYLPTKSEAVDLHGTPKTLLETLKQTDNADPLKVESSDDDNDNDEFYDACSESSGQSQSVVSHIIDLCRSPLRWLMPRAQELRDPTPNEVRVEEVVDDEQDSKEEDIFYDSIDVDVATEEYSVFPAEMENDVRNSGTE